MSQSVAAREAGSEELARSQCLAYADSTGERCRRTPLSGVPYCPLHLHLYDPDTVNSVKSVV